MSKLDFKSFRFNPKLAVVSDEELDENDVTLTLNTSGPSQSKPKLKNENSDEDAGQAAILNGRRARKSRVRYVESQSEQSASDGEDGSDPTFGKSKKIKSTLANLPKTSKASKAQIVRMPALRKETNDFRPLKHVDKGLFDMNSSTHEPFEPLKKRNLVLIDDSSNGSVASSQMDDLQMVFNEDSNASQASDRSIKCLNGKKNVAAHLTPKRKKCQSSDEEEFVSKSRKKQRRRVLAFQDDSSNDTPTVSNSDSSKENVHKNVPQPELIDDIEVMLEDDQSDLNEDSEYSDDDIVFDSDNEDKNEDEDEDSGGRRKETSKRIKSKPTTESNVSSFNLKKLILELLNSGTEADLLNVPTLTRKKMDLVIAMRPFENWNDLMHKFEDSSALPMDLLEHIKNNAKSRFMITLLLNNCKKISDQIQNTVDNLRGLTQPRILNRDFQLKPYQLIGLNWMAMMHDKGINGILADEMGLGKTIQVISLLAHLRINKNIRGPHMIVVPSSILANWAREFELWCPHIKILVYHGSQAERADMRQLIYSKSIQYDVLLTTYNLCYSADDRKLFTRTSFVYIIFDEAHMLKNMKTARFNNLISLKSKYRLMLTGTPIQNNLLELMTLLLFTLPNIFGSKRTYIESFFRDKKIETDMSEFVQTRIQQAKEILKPFILRRLKENVLKDLPSKIEKYEHVPMGEYQRQCYDRLIDEYKQQFEEMRQQRIKLKEKPEPEVEILDTKRKRTFITYDEDKFLDIALGETNDDADEDAEANTKSKGKSKTKTNGNGKQTKSVQDEPQTTPEILISDQSNDSTSNDSDNVELKASTLNRSTAMMMNLRKCANHPLLLRKHYTDELLMQMARTLKQKEDYYRSDGNVQYIFEDMQQYNDFDLHALCKKFGSLNKYQLSQDKILDSGKFKYLDEFLPKLTNQGHRVLIFSQFQMMLDILEDYLNIRKHRFVRLDGATKVTDRMGIIDNFYEDKDIRVFLITTKAGGLGINLVEANHVIIHDIDFNPYNDKQAEDRAHRMGQTKNVYVYKLVSSDSIEIQMMNTCIRKLEVGRTITSDHVDKDNKAKDAKDIKAMLKNALRM